MRASDARGTAASAATLPRPWRPGGQDFWDGGETARTYVGCVQRDPSINETLRVARDLCLGVGAFCVTPAGIVVSEISDALLRDDAKGRIVALARSCLSHPGAHGKELFWSAQPDGAGPSYPESSLACVVAPIWHGEHWLGLLGVVDVWLPQLDAGQREGLLSLADELAGASSGETTRPAPAPAPPAPAVPVASAEHFLGEVLDNLPEGLVVTRGDGTIVLVNQTFSTITGLDMDSVLGVDVTEVIEPAATSGVQSWEDLAASSEGLAAVLEPLLGSAEPPTSLVVEGAGRRTILQADGRRLESRFAGDCFVTLVRPADVRDRLGGPKIRQLLDHVEDGIVCTDAHGTVLLANRAARLLHGLGNDQLLVGQPFPAATTLRDAQGQAVTAESHPLWRAMREGAPVDEDLVLREGERLVHVAVSARPLRVDDGDGAIAVLRDVTADRERQEHLTQYALHDPLTGVANRYLLNDALGRMLDGLARRGGSVSLVYLDLDNFKAINDEHGHEIGDEVLRAIARRLERAVRGEDVVARIGGDEFVVAHLSGERLSDGDTVVARIRKVLSAPYRFGNIALDVRASVGWVSAAGGGDAPEALISRADRSMYRQKLARRTQANGIPA